MTYEYRVEFTIQRAEEGADDWQDIGFGSSGAWASIDQASHMVASALGSGEWETEPGMPDPEEVDR